MLLCLFLYLQFHTNTDTDANTDMVTDDGQMDTQPKGHLYVLPRVLFLTSLTLASAQPSIEADEANLNGLPINILMPANVQTCLYDKFHSHIFLLLSLAISSQGGTCSGYDFFFHPRYRMDDRYATWE